MFQKIHTSRVHSEDDIGNGRYFREAEFARKMLFNFSTNQVEDRSGECQIMIALKCTNKNLKYYSQSSMWKSYLYCMKTICSCNSFLLSNRKLGQHYFIIIFLETYTYNEFFTCERPYRKGPCSCNRVITRSVFYMKCLTEWNQNQRSGYKVHWDRSPQTFKTEPHYI